MRRTDASNLTLDRTATPLRWRSMRFRVNETTVPSAVGRGLRGGSPLLAEALAVFLAGAAMVIALGMLLGDAPAIVAALAFYLFGGSIAALGLRTRYPHHEFGLCNAITLVRLAMTSALLVLFFTPGAPQAQTIWLAFAVAVVSLSLDGVDGWAARRANLTSGFGARFDMEVDSALALVLALLACDLGHSGPWIVALGLPHYLFVAAGQVFPWLRADLPERFSRKAVCVLQIGVLVALLAPIVPQLLGTIFGLVAVLAVLWSFGRDILFLYQRR